MLTTREIDELKLIRETARKSLYFLCTRLLNYNDIDPRVHMPFIRPLDNLVTHCTGTDIVTANGECMYIPDEETFSVAIPRHVKRRYMLLAFRGSLKTTINTVAHTIQLILNFPHIAILIYHNTEAKAKLMLSEIATHFRSNDKLREIFPEFAVNSDTELRRAMSQVGFAFTTPARKIVPSLLPEKKEPTITALGLGTSQAGQHVSAMKMSDVVEDTNSQTPAMRMKVYKQIQMAINLLEDPSCLVFLEGTPYDPEDAYSRIMQTQYFALPPRDRTWHFTYLPAYEVDTGGKPRSYDLDEAALPWKVATKDYTISSHLTIKKGEKIPVWPTWRGGEPKFTPKALAERQRDDPYIFSCQQLLRPTAEGSSPLAPGKCFHPFPATELSKLDIQLTLMAVDTAETENINYSNDTAISVAKVTQTQLRVVTAGLVGMLEAEDIVKSIFEYYENHRPDVVLIEETSFVRGLKPTIREEEAKRGYQLPVEWLPRKPSQSKIMRIKGSLRIPLFTQRLMFSTALNETYIERLKVEMSGFPRDSRNDILDTLADICAASPNLANYNNPKLQALAERHNIQQALKQDFDDWADLMTGRIIPQDLEAGDYHGENLEGF
jgi:hypothetical protein